MIYEKIDKWALTEPNRIVYRGERTFTYQELKEQSDRLANYFSETLPNREPIVVYGGQEFEMLVAFVAAAKSGHAYIPIEAHTPNDRTALILEVAQPTLVLAVAAWPDIETVCPIADMATIPATTTTVLNQGLTPEETIYIIFTSGTTGVPKGVQISQANLWSFIEWELADLGIKTGDRFLSQAPFSFDLSVMSVYPALIAGGSLVPMEKAVIDDFQTLFARLPHLPIDVWVSTPSFMEICLMEPTFSAEVLPALRVFLFCGEELTKQTASKLLERFPEAQIYNTYGPTEATVAISQVLVTKELVERESRIPIGYIKEDTTVTIMEGETILPAGEVGEIVITGPSVSKGYLNNPEKTQAVFFELNGQPAYRTGDAGRLMPDGLLRYEGRIDFQVKLHGYRIELEDIDHHLTNVSYVKQATVVPKYKEHKVQQLVAFVVAQPHTFAKQFELTKAIRQELAASVMDYMIPQKYIYVEQLPRTANGKIDRKQLIHEVNPT